DRMLTTVADATKDLLNSSNTDLEQVIPAALRVLGEGLGCDRVNLLENFGQSATQVPGHTKVIYGWAEPDTVTQLPHPDATQIDGEGLEAFTGQYLQNNGFGGLVDDWPEPLRSAFKAIDMRSSYSVPIWLGEKFWGIVAFDYCHEAKQVSSAEMAILRTAAACIGGAIQRDRTQKAILQAEQAQVAKLMKTNQALKNNLDRLAAESSLDAFLGHVLTEISQQLNIQTVWLYLYEHTDQTLQLHRWVEQGEVQPPANFAQLGPMANPIAVANLAIWEHLRQTRTPFVITPDNADQSEQFMFPGTQDWQLQWAKQNNIQSGVNILLMLGETPLGLLGLLSAQRSGYASEELALVQALTHQATLAIQLTRLADEAKQSTLYEERSRLAGEIHDTLAQTFTGISVQLELAQYLIGQSAQESDRAEVGSTLERIGSLAQTGLAEARRSVWSLYSATEDYTNLAERLADCIATLAKGTDLHTQVDLKGDPYPLNYFVGKNLLRIGQEAITNTFRHAQATELWVELTYAPNQVSLRVSDNGCGFAPQAQAEGFGLVSISERADRIGGQLRITTQPERGTEIFVQVPL
ncbi:MAG: GAF domain-containing sensor histidine kinase, partial [Cyanobacteria bacterium P01_C01_bin.120]